MNKKTSTLCLFTLVAASGPLWAVGSPIMGDFVIQSPGKGSLAAEATINILPASPLALPLPSEAFSSQGPSAAIPRLPAEASISVLPAAIVHASPSLFQSASFRNAAQADVQAMIAPKEALVPAGQDVSKMSGDEASGAGEAIMDRILYIKGTPAASAVALPVAGSQSAAPSRLKRAPRNPLYYLLVGPAKIASASTEYISKKTHAGPFWVAGAMSMLNVVAALRTMTGPSWDLPMPGSHMTGTATGLMVGFIVMSLMYLAHASWWAKADAEEDAVKKMNAAVSKGQESLKAHPGVLSVSGETVPGKNGNDHFIIVKVSQLSAKNLNQIPLNIDGLQVKVQFAN